MTASPELDPRRPTRWPLALTALALLFSLYHVVQAALLPLELFFQTGPEDRIGQFVFYNSHLGGGHFGMPVELGDYDADGQVDLVVAPMAAPSGPDKTRIDAGEVYVLRGDGELRGKVDHRTFEDDTFPGLTILGARKNDYLGTELFTADVNGDGVQDLIIGAQNHDGPAGDRPTAGGVFVIFGREGLLESGSVIDLLTLDQAPHPDVLTLIGERPGDRLGLWVEAGDFDGDGIDDLFLGGDQSSGADTEDDQGRVGMAAIVYGRTEWPAIIDLATAREEIEGVSYLYGRDGEDHFGASLHARDLDGDGRDEVIVAASLNRFSASLLDDPAVFEAEASGGGDGPEPDDVIRRFSAGEVYILFSEGEESRLPQEIDFASPLPPEISGRLATIYGANRDDTVGEELTSGDFDGDGHADLALGAITASNPDGTALAGATFVLYRPDLLRGQTLDLATLGQGPDIPGFQVSSIYGLEARDILGDTLSVGDFNRDGFDDLAVGIPHRQLQGKRDTGEVAVLFGSPERFPDQLYPSAPDVDPSVLISYVRGPDANDNFSYSMEARDYDGDGFDDLFPNAMRGDGADNDVPDAGEVYLVSGFFLSGQRVTVTGVEPRLLPPGRPHEVIVTGSGFTVREDMHVFLGDQEVTEFTSESGTRLVVTLPAIESPGEFPLRVENRHGTFTAIDPVIFGSELEFSRGDSNLDGTFDIGDPVFTLAYLFLGKRATCLDAQDVDDSGMIDIGDPVRALRYLFLGNVPAPPAPFPGAGSDPTEDALTCP